MGQKGVNSRVNIVTYNSTACAFGTRPRGGAPTTYAQSRTACTQLQSSGLTWMPSIIKALL